MGRLAEFDDEKEVCSTYLGLVQVQCINQEFHNFFWGKLDEIRVSQK